MITHIGVNSMGVNLNVAIYTGFAGAVFLSVFPAIFKRKSFKEFIENFIMCLIGFTILGYITAFFMDTQMPSPTLFMDTQMSSPKRLKRIETEYIMDGHFIHFQNVIMPKKKKS